MSNRSVSRTVGKAVCRYVGTSARGWAAAVVLTVLPTYRLTAQVGHDPARSPFADVTTKQTITVFGGNFFGNRTVAQVGPQQSPMMGFRLATALSGPLDLMVTTSLVPSQRYAVNTTLPDSTRRTGPIDYTLIVADVALSLRLTGSKTWHGMAPYLIAGAGIVAPTRTIADVGGYRAGAGFTFSPGIGVRARLSRTLGLHVEARDNTIRYEWPDRYFAPIDASGNAITPPVLNPATTLDKQLTHNFSVTFGLSYSFNF